VTVPLDTLSEFIAAIEQAGELVRVTHPVRAHLEICEITDRVSKLPGGGHALLFEHVLLRDGTRSALPVASNLFGSMRRMALAFGVASLDEPGQRITELLDMKVPEGLMGKLSMLPRLLEVGKFPPRVKSGRPPCQEIVWRGDEIDLDKIPVLTCWPEDGGPYVTLTMCISKDPGRGIRNVGMYRVQQLGKREVAMHWQRHKTGAEHWRQMAEKGETMPVCIVVGADPASVYSASAPLPPGIDEFLLAGFLRREPVKLARAVTCDLEVPWEAELVIEGYIDPREALVVEGPFGDHTGYYSEADLYPKVHVTAVTMRRDAVYATTIVGKPPMEDYYLGHATERLFLPLLKLTNPEVVDYHMPVEGGFHNLVFVSIDKKYPGAGVQGDERALGAGADGARQGHRRRRQGGRRAQRDRSVVGGAQQHRPRARRALHPGAGGRARPREPRLHLRQQDGDRRHAQAARGGLHASVAQDDRDGRRHACRGRRHVGTARHPSTGRRRGPRGAALGGAARHRRGAHRRDAQRRDARARDAARGGAADAPDGRRRARRRGPRRAPRRRRARRARSAGARHGRPRSMSAAPTPAGETLAQPAREPQTYGGLSRFARYASFVKLPHTVFALPFALVGVVLASWQHAVDARVVGWVVLAFTAARFAAMGFNRIVDRDVDAANPRTATRELPSGALALGEARLSVLVASVLFVVAAGALNRLCLALSPIALGWVFLYSYTKRFTRFSHLVLGLGLGIAPVGGYLAVTGQWSEPWWLLCALSLAVTTWVGGFDIFYALQDEQFDRITGLHSIPVAFGERRAIAIARGLHVATVAMLAAVAWGAPAANAWLWAGAALVAALLAWEHRLVRPGDLSRLDAAFFTMNGVISLTFFACVLAGRVFG
jgi:4-hydroxy-3-polyprenylbenzoate decarboxylase